MRTVTKRFLGTMVLPALFLLALLLFARPPDNQVAAQSGVTNVTTLKASRDVLAGRDITATRSISAGDNVAVGNFLMLHQEPTLLVAMNGALNPTGTNQPISATVGSAVATSGANITVKPRDTVLILRNVGAQTITFTETGTLVSAGNVALGTLDSATFVSDGTKWHQVAGSNN